MKKFNVNHRDDFNIYGEILPINAIYGKYHDDIYYLDRMPANSAKSQIYVLMWRGDLHGFVYELASRELTAYIYANIEKHGLSNMRIMRNVFEGINTADTMSRVERKHKPHVLKAGACARVNKREREGYKSLTFLEKSIMKTSRFDPVRVKAH